MAKKKKYSAVAKRQEILNQQRNLKMARSAHAYVRGSTQKFYEWLASENSRKIPQGPPVWICGDCHVGNLGPIANAKGDIDIQIRDLDQTVIGNPAHDLIRLGMSLASAARGSDLPGVNTALMLENMIQGYEDSLVNVGKDQTEEIERPEVVQKVMASALNRKWRHLAKERIEDTRPKIPLGKRFWPLAKVERKALKELFADEQVRRLVTSLRSRKDGSPVKILDAAYWVKGCSSLGGLRYAVLLQIGGKKGKRCLMDVKEAVAPLAPRHAKSKIPKDHAERVAKGAWSLSPALGDRIVAKKFLGKSVFIRELLPQDLKFEIEHLTPDEAMKVAKFLAAIVGKAHARQMDELTRQAWQKQLEQHRPKDLDAPSWLWSNVVDLVVSHEGAYLEHCRKYALALKNAPKDKL